MIEEVQAEEIKSLMGQINKWKSEVDQETLTLHTM